MAFVCLAVSAPALAQSAPPLPAPTGQPLTIDFSADPVLRLRRQQSGFEQFRAAIASAVERHPGTAESAATEDEALAQLDEARAAGLPTVDLSVTSYRVVARDFSNDPFNIIERSRPRPAHRRDPLGPAAAVRFRRDRAADHRRRRAAPGRRRRPRGRAPTGSRSTPSPPGTTSSPIAPSSASPRRSSPASAICAPRSRSGSARASRPRATSPGSIPTSPRPRPGSPASAACSPMPRRASPS